MGDIIANEMQTRMVKATGPSIDSIQKLVALVSSIHYGEVFFIDEIHRLPKAVEEVLYSVLEDSAIFAVMGRTVVNRSLPKFTVVGATTKFALIAAPLRDRFTSCYRLDFYSVEVLQKIVIAASRALGSPIEASAAQLIAERARGTPRVANKLLKRCRDYAQVLGNGDITAKSAGEQLTFMGIDELGLGPVEYQYLNVLVNQLEGGPAGLEVIAARISEDESTVADTVEPYLMRVGMLDRTSKGRCATPAAFEWLFKHKMYLERAA